MVVYTYHIRGMSSLYIGSQRGRPNRADWMCEFEVTVYFVMWWLSHFK